MADISMCMDDQCPKRGECHRFTATPNMYGQTYSAFSRKGNDKCEYFYPNTEYPDEIKRFKLKEFLGD